MDWIKEILENIVFYGLEIGVFALLFFLLKKSVDGKTNPISTEEGAKLTVGNYNNYLIYIFILFFIGGIISVFLIIAEDSSQLGLILFCGLMTLGLGFACVYTYLYGRNHWAVYNNEW